MNHVEQYASVEKYDVGTDRWSLVPSLNIARENCSSCCLNDSLYVFCGFSYKRGYLNNIECLDVKAHLSG